MVNFSKKALYIVLYSITCIAAIAFNIVAF